MNFTGNNFTNNAAYKNSGIDKNTAMQRVAQIDLTQINRKLMLEDSARWNDETLAGAEKMYRRFLALHAIFPSTDLVPTKTLDEYWHQHILDTKKYAKDCDFLFGEFLHHDPYFGINGEQDRMMNQKAFEWTRLLWETSFGEPLLGECNPCSSTDCR
jgi:hypothetical protein